VLIDGAAALVHQSTVQCLMCGGVIKVLKHNQDLETDGATEAPKQEKEEKKKEEEQEKEEYQINPRRGVKINADVGIKSIPLHDGLKLDISLSIKDSVTKGQFTVTLNTKDLSIVSISDEFGNSIKVNSVKGLVIDTIIKFSRSQSINFKSGSKINYGGEFKTTPFGNTGIIQVSFETPEGNKANLELALERKKRKKGYETVLVYADKAAAYIYQTAQAYANEVAITYKKMGEVAGLSAAMAKAGVIFEWNKTQKNFQIISRNVTRGMNNITSSVPTSSSSSSTAGEAALTSDLAAALILLLFCCACA
jgi:hypothetical protein